MSKKKIRKKSRPGIDSARTERGSATARVLACDDCGCGLVSFAVPVPDMRMDEFVLYMDAHHLMPFDYDYDPATCAELVGESLFVAAEDHLAPELRLRAIAILGHSPCAEALSVLAEVASSDDPLAGVAQLAFGECQGMVETFGMAPSPMSTVH